MQDKVMSSVVVMMIGGIGGYVVYTVVGTFNFGSDTLASALQIIFAGLVLAIAVIGAIMLLGKNK